MYYSFNEDKNLCKIIIIIQVNLGNYIPLEEIGNVHLAYLVKECLT